MNTNASSSNLSMLTDLYQLTMANGYWQQRMYGHEAVFHLFYRAAPFQNGFVVAAGLAQAVAYLQNLRFTFEDIRYLSHLKGADGRAIFEENFLNFLQRFKFSCDVDAVAEGTVVFPHQPLLRVRGNLIEAQFVETALLTILNFQTLIATKAARIKAAAGDDAVLEFGLRRAQGTDGGLTASRAAYIGGCDATSNVLAGQRFGIPIRGTHAHSWVMAFEDEAAAFEAYAEAMPNNCTFLVDTYDTISGVKNAIKVGLRLRERGHDLLGIRLDSGDLAALSIKARAMLDAAGFANTAIVASNDLDEYEIQKLKAQGAKITVWGVGTRLVTAFEQPALGGVYKLGAIRSDAAAEWQFKMKFSETPEKRSNPGILQTRRYLDAQRQPLADVIFNTETTTPITDFVDAQNARHALTDFPTATDFEDLLQPIFRHGKLVYNLPSIHEIRRRSLQQFPIFADKVQAAYPAGLERRVYEQKIK